MPDSVQQHVWPVWGNTYWVKNCLGLYEGIAKHADELNGQYAHFFGLVQKLSLDAAALGICRLYDQGGGRYALDTIPRLIGYLRNHLTEEYIPLLKSEMLMSLGADEHSARDIVNNLKNDGASLATRNCLCDFLDRLSPAWDRTPALKRLKIYRDKRIVLLRHKLQKPSNNAAFERLKHWQFLPEITACAGSPVSL